MPAGDVFTAGGIGNRGPTAAIRAGMTEGFGNFPGAYGCGARQFRIDAERAQTARIALLVDLTDDLVGKGLHLAARGLRGRAVGDGVAGMVGTKVGFCVGVAAGVTTGVGF